MSPFEEALKKIFTAVDGFLNTTLKSESLGKKTEKERTKIVELLQKLYAEYDYLNPGNCDEGSSTSSKDPTQDESRNTFGSSNSNEDEAYNDDIPDTTVKSLTNHIKAGFLQKKRSVLGNQKCYCVLHKNVMYWFKKHTDKKQQGHIIMTGYEVRDIPQTEKDSAKREFPFELICTGKKSYLFIAETKEDLDSWRQAVVTSSKHVEAPSVSKSISQDNIDEFEEVEDLYEPIKDVSEKMRKHQLDSEAPPDQPINKSKIEEQDVYEESESEITTAPKLPSRNTQVTKASASTPIIAMSDETDDQIYEPVDALKNSMPMTGASLKVANTQGPRSSIPVCAPPLPPHEKPSGDNIPPPLPSRGANFPQNSEKSSKELPPLPQKNKRTLTLGNVDLSEEDYENLYYGMWKCLGSTENELSFEEGEIIHIINKELDSENWWVGELKGQVGLVPKPYLSQAYELVA